MLPRSSYYFLLISEVYLLIKKFFFLLRYFLRCSINVLDLSTFSKCRLIRSLGETAPPVCLSIYKEKIVSFCFLDEDGDMQIDLVEALGMFEMATLQLLEDEISEKELPFFLFLCGAEALLRTSEEKGSIH